jgi:superfamily II DNA or RNA helicase
MRSVENPYEAPSALVLGRRINTLVPESDQIRQRAEVDEALSRLRAQPGVILADEVGMGKTFVALGIAYSIAVNSPRGPVIVMVPANLISKWEQDLKTFCELYLENRRAVVREDVDRKNLFEADALRYGIARHSVELLKLLDDDRRNRVHLVFLAQGSMARSQTDRWIRLALIAEALRSRRSTRLVQVKEQIHRFLGELLKALGQQRATDLDDQLWRRLLKTDPQFWKDTYNAAMPDTSRWLRDDPVPKAVLRALRNLDLSPLAEALKEMPVRARGDEARLSERISVARRALKDVERHLWTALLAKARWRSPLLVMDEAHHLKNPETSLARTFRAGSLDEDLRTGDGAMADAFDRMLFLTATPFQLGHHELVRVLERFGDVRWKDSELGPRDRFEQRLKNLESQLNASQRGAIALQRNWSRLRRDDSESDIETWWRTLLAQSNDAFVVAKQAHDAAEIELRPWVVRHNKGAVWSGTEVSRRQRLEGGAITGVTGSQGLPIPPDQLLPFFLGARSAAHPSAELLTEALCSSYEAFRHTRISKSVAKDDEGNGDEPPHIDLSRSDWYLGEFDRALEATQGATHPKIHATVRRVTDLWQAGEKVLVFAFYRHTCRALRIHISREIERRLRSVLGERLEPIQKRFFDDTRSPGRQALDRELREIMRARSELLDQANITPGQREDVVAIMRRFLRSETTLVRCFPIAQIDALEPQQVVQQALDKEDSSNTSWRQKFDGFLQFLAKQSSAAERADYLEAALGIQTGRIRVEDDEEGAEATTMTLPNVQVATGTTRTDARARLMRAFNTPFLPDILVCSEVMGEGVDLQRACRHVIHHDLAWNPSTIEQRTGRVDRLGCKAEGKHPIVVHLPYLAGTADERQFQVMSHREQWFRIVMGQEEVARLITTESTAIVPLPEAISHALSFKLGIRPTG